jgi:hypothetical protein
VTPSGITSYGYSAAAQQPVRPGVHDVDRDPLGRESAPDRRGQLDLVLD